MPSNDPQPNNPLHGITLAAILDHLVERYGWEELGTRIDIRCFTHDPSVKSSLKFLRRTDWARAKVERLYLKSVCYGKPNVIESDDEGQDREDQDNADLGKKGHGNTGSGNTEPTEWER